MAHEGSLRITSMLASILRPSAVSKMRTRSCFGRPSSARSVWWHCEQPSALRSTFRPISEASVESMITPSLLKMRTRSMFSWRATSWMMLCT